MVGYGRRWDWRLLKYVVSEVVEGLYAGMGWSDSGAGLLHESCCKDMQATTGGLID